MNFKNHTAFPALSFDGLDQHDILFHTVVMRLTFHWQDDGSLALAPEQTPLATADAYYGALKRSGVREESDLAPYKQYTDVIVNAHAYAPGGKPTRHFDVRLRVRNSNTPTPLPEPPRGLNPLQAPSDKDVANWQRAAGYTLSRPIPGAIQLDKTLTISGERYFRKKAWPFRLFWWALKWASLGLIRRNPWKLTTPKKLTELPLRYEYAFGGECRVHADDKTAKRVPKKQKLTLAQQTQHPEQPAPIAHAVCELNPIGAGYSAAWYLKATKLKRIAAPQIEAASTPITAQLFWRALNGKLKHAKPQQQAAFTPAGLGILPGTWQPRLPLAGTYDQAWLTERHPYLPQDYNIAYWNTAPSDQQVKPHLEGDASITLTNLCPLTTPGATQDNAGNTQLTLTLPGLLPCVLVRFEDGRIDELAAKLDTLIIDTLPDQDNPNKKSSVVCVWRTRVAAEPAVRALEAHMSPRSDTDALRAEVSVEIEPESTAAAAFTLSLN